jgi:hypothetical protein
MKKLLIALAAVLVTAASYAQGTLNFNTRFTAAGVNAPVVLSTGGGPGPSYSAALYLVSGGTDTLVPNSTTTFRDGSTTAALAQYVNPITVEIPGVGTGGTATLKIKAWQTSLGTYETAQLARGESAVFTTTPLGGGPTPPGDLPSSLQGFTVNVIPEPSTIALGALGAAALLLRRRK